MKLTTFPSNASKFTTTAVTARTVFNALVVVTLLASAPLVNAADVKPAAAKAVPSDAQARFNEEAARCKEGRSNQDLETCLREARNALAEAQRGQLARPGADLNANAKARCEPLPADQRADCLKRVDGQGVVSGSVQSGGIYRETTTIVPAPSAPAASAGR